MFELEDPGLGTVYLQAVLPSLLVRRTPRMIGDRVPRTTGKGLQALRRLDRIIDGTVDRIPRWSTLTVATAARSRSDSGEIVQRLSDGALRGDSIRPWYRSDHRQIVAIFVTTIAEDAAGDGLEATIRQGDSEAASLTRFGRVPRRSAGVQGVAQLLGLLLQQLSRLGAGQLLARRHRPRLRLEADGLLMLMLLLLLLLLLAVEVLSLLPVEDVAQQPYVPEESVISRSTSL